MEFGSTYTGLMHRLRKEGWVKGVKVNTFFCNAPACRRARQNSVDETANNERHRLKKSCKLVAG